MSDVHSHNVNVEDIALATWCLRNHPLWSMTIRKAMRAGCEDAYKIHEWITDPRVGGEKLARKLKRDAETDPEAFANQQFLVFNNWSVETKDAIARAVMHVKTKGITRLDKPSLIIKATR